MRIFVLFIFALWPALSLAADQNANANCPRSCAEPSHNHNWGDSSRDYISNRADSLVRWVDGFFGAGQQQAESETSYMRLRMSAFTREGEVTRYRVNLRGKVYLKNLDDRLSLLFADDDDSETRIQNVDDASQRVNESTDVSLQFNEIETDRHRLDYRVGIRSSLRPKAEIRYRYELPYRRNELFKSVQRLRYRGEDGFDIVSEFEQSHAMSNSRVLRAAAQFHYGEITNGVEWQTSLLLSKKLSEHKAIVYFATSRGHTRPTAVTQTYGVGFNFRQAIYKDWVFLETEPGYFWNKDFTRNSREGALQLIMRLGVLFD